MSSGARRDRDDRPRDWREAHLSSGPSHSPKRKDGPEDRVGDYRGYPRHRGDRRSHHKASYRRDSYHERERSYFDRRDTLDYGDPKPSDDRRKSRTPPRSPARPSAQREELEDGEIPASTPNPPRHPTPPLNGNETPKAPDHLVEPLPDLELSLPLSPPPIEDIIAARRAKRAAIIAKYQVTGSGTPSQAAPEPTAFAPAKSESNGTAPATPAPGPTFLVPQQVEELSDGQVTPPEREQAVFDLFKGGEEKAAPIVVPSLSNVVSTSVTVEPQDQVSAADYDPSMDRREDDARQARHAAALADGTGETLNQPKVTMESGGTGKVEEKVGEDDDDDDDVDDMFAIAIDADKPKKRKVAKDRVVPRAIALVTVDTAADHEGYYQIVLGEALDGGRYQVFSNLGRGMFSAVVRARVIQGEGQGKEVAIKIIRAQESMFKAGLKEVQILNKLMQADPDDKKHIVRLERTFEHRGHLCLVFESLSMNLREVVKRFGKDVGLNVAAVRAYAYQLFLALLLLKKCNIMHADIKPDNILVNDSKNNLKLCDLGSASDVTENAIAPYLVSRFYRAPEIILGLPYDTGIDVWSVGCTLFELYTGKILFPGRTNNQMLLHMMELKGRFNSKLIKKAQFGDAHFDESGLFTSVDFDRVAGKEVIKQMSITKPKRDMRARIVPAPSKLKEDELKVLLAFVDLLDKCLTLDPTKRITPKEALNHPFVRG